MIRSSLIFLALSIAFNSNAALVIFSGTPNADNIYPEATINLADANTPVKLLGASLRYKYKTIFKFQVYLAANYADTAPILKDSKARLMELIMKRDMDGDTVGSAFRDALYVTNKVPTSKAIENILKTFDSGVKEGDVVLLAMRQKGANEVLSVELRRGNEVITTATEEAENIGTDVWKIWCGEPADKGLTELKPLICGN